MVTDQILLEIAERAGSLEERLTGIFLPVPVSELNPVQTVEERLARWQKALGGNLTAWERRLEWGGLDEAQIRLALGKKYLADRQVLPAWTFTLRAMLETEADAPGELNFRDPTDPVPFEDLLEIFVVWARRELQARQPWRDEVFSTEAETNLDRYLLGLLCRLSSLALQTEFKVFCSRCQVFRLFQSFVPAAEGDEKSTRLYDDFVKEIRQDHFVKFFLEYSVLGRLLVIACENWLAAMGEFGERARRDLPDISRLFFEGRQPGRIARAEPGLSDPHRGGRSVIRLKFEDGSKLVYKPKDQGLEVAFNQLLNWLNSTGELLPFKVLQVVDRTGYGWVEYVEQLPCPDTAALDRYYRRLGMLLGLLHLLNGTDCHYENLIACGEYPVMIDTETLLHPSVPYVLDPTASGENLVKLEAMAQNLENSILRTALLPYGSGEEAGPDFSAFSAVEEQNTNYNLPHWAHINTDRMEVTYEKATLEPGLNVPRLEGFTLNLAEHAEVFKAGFEEMYRFLVNKRVVLRAENSPLHLFSQRTGRFLFRNTRVYGLLLHQATQPGLLREGVDRSIHFEKISRAFLMGGERPVYWALLDQERLDLEQLDIPIFSCNSSKRAIQSGEEELVEGWYRRGGLEAVFSRLGSLGEADLARQQASLEEALRSRFAGENFKLDILWV